MHARIIAPREALSFPYALLSALLAILLPAAFLFSPIAPPQARHLGDSLRMVLPARQGAYGELPLYFVANQGQVDGPVAYYIQGRDKSLYFTPQGVTFSFASTKTPWVAKLDFVEAKGVQPAGKEKTSAVFSYFKGSQSQWRTGIPSYSEIAYTGLWPGIDLVYSGTVDRLEYRFIVSPGADPARIRLAYRGATLSLEREGGLEVTTPAGSFTDEAPLAYQEKDGQHLPVSVAYDLDSAEYGFRIGAYNPQLPLVIDPAFLVYAGFIGGSAIDGDNDFATDIAVDSLGSAYIVGTTTSTQTTFPVIAGPDLTHNGGEDAFIAKVSPDGTHLEYCGYIGGSYTEEGRGVAVDTDGYAYITGTTYSPQTQGFPVIVGPDLTFNSLTEAFITKLSPNGQTLIYSGYIGGNERDYGNDIAIDNLGSAYVVGDTYGASFPVLVGPDTIVNGSIDAFITKVRADGTGLVYSGYIGGDVNDYGNGVAVDPVTGNAYITGTTYSSQATFPRIVGPDLTNAGNGEAFVAKVRADGTGLDYCGYIGGSGTENGNAIAIDSLGNAYVTGYTSSSQSSFPVLVGPDLTFGGNGDGFIAKVLADGTGFGYCGYIGGASLTKGWGIAVDSQGCAYVTGGTSSNQASFPVLVGPDLTFNGGGYDAFISKVKADGTGFAYSGYIGGSGNDYGESVALDSNRNAYIAGTTPSTEATFPVLLGPDLTYNGGTQDIFVAKVSLSLAVNPTSIPTGLVGSAYSQTFSGADGIAPYTLVLNGALPSGLTFVGDLLSGTPTETGSFPIEVQTTDVNGDSGSRAYTLEVSYPVPAGTALNPGGVSAGGPDFTLVITGTNFTNASVVQWDGSPLATTFSSTTRLSATVPAASSASPKAYAVTVSNPAPGGGASAPLFVYVTQSGAAVSSAGSAANSTPGGALTATTGGSGAGTPGSLTISTTGIGSAGVAIYGGNPAGTALLFGSGAYFDVHLAPPSNFTTAQIVACSLVNGSLVYWWDGAAWRLASDQAFNHATGCATLTVTADTHPSLADLDGTPFSASLPVIYIPILNK